MIETEAKFVCTDRDAIVRTALDHGFRMREQKEQEDTYFLVNRVNADGTRDYLRIREDVRAQRYSLDFHRVISSLETQENEIAIGSKEAMKEMLCALGFKIVCVVKKRREEYSDGETVITIDSVENLGRFVEIESGSEGHLRTTASILGLEFDKRVQMKGYPDLLMESQGNFK